VRREEEKTEWNGIEISVLASSGSCGIERGMER